MSQSNTCSCNLYTNAQAVKWLILQEVAMDQEEASFACGMRCSKTNAGGAPVGITVWSSVSDCLIGEDQRGNRKLSDLTSFVTVDHIPRSAGCYPASRYGSQRFDSNIERLRNRQHGRVV